MAYSSVWNNARPQGTVDADTIDEEIQQVRIDISDRIKDLFGITDFTLDPLLPNYVRVGYGGAGTGGHVRYTDDSNTLRWEAGVLPGAGNRVFGIYDEVNGFTRFSIDENTGVVDVRVALSIGSSPSSTGIIRVPNNNAIKSRNAADNADLAIAYIDNANTLQLGNGNSIVLNGAVTAAGGVTGNVTGNVTGSSSSCTGNAATATTAAACSGNAATATLAHSCDGNSATATTAASCSGNAATATNATNLGGVAAGSYALLSETRNFVTTGSVTAHSFFVV